MKTLSDDGNDEPAAIYAESVRRITFKPGDVAVLTSKRPLSYAYVDRIKEQWVQMFPDVQCMVLECLELSIANTETAS